MLHVSVACSHEAVFAALAACDCCTQVESLDEAISAVHEHEQPLRTVLQLGGILCADADTLAYPSLSNNLGVAAYIKPGDTPESKRSTSSWASRSSSTDVVSA